MIRNRNSSDALALADAAQGEGLTRSGETARARTRAVMGIVGRIFDLIPEETGGARRREEALQAAALAACVPEGGVPDGEALLAAGYAPAVVDAMVRLSQGPGRLTLVQDSEDLARSGDVGMIAARYAAMTHDSRTDRIMGLPPAERGVLGVYHKSRKALAAAFLDVTGVDIRGVEETDGTGKAMTQGPALDEARAAAGRDLAGLPTQAPALALLDHIGSQDPRTLTLAEALSAMGRSEPDADGMAALAYLSQGAKAALDVTVVFVDERGVSHALATGAAARATSDGYMHPVTGEPVTDPESRFFLRIAPRAGLFPEPAKSRSRAAAAPKPDASEDAGADTAEIPDANPVT